MTISNRAVRTGGKNKTKAKLIYAVTAGALDDDLDDLFGINKAPIYSLNAEGVGVVISDLPSTQLRPDRRNIMAHSEILKRLMSQTTVLPVRFGTIAAGDRAIQRFLSQYKHQLVEQLERLQDRVEMGLRVSWNVPDIYEYFVRQYPELRRQRDQVYGTGSKPGRDERINLGHMYDKLVNEARSAHRERLEQIILPSCDAICSNTPKNEKVVLNLACLVRRDNLAAFERQIAEAADIFDDSYTIDLNGPWAPHNFVDLDLKAITGRS
ncbi:GvpL/GvpF family gas vesicle protein [Shewanella salipaludis]|uniref:GvpL/GvpF family gas vesicle protein n=1 Tax=Shewanella salipaludis TaxID=2723052 RepID=A0A972JNS7_9GAMM|nr:GvpL/GvpF family gas vesicle protein [Shewanella salipaludis]NMH66456.1 GvpL/GvpF family gas vesicle protein [Shewanella salipaludis]